jgi:hypothetical protein
MGGVFPKAEKTATPFAFQEKYRKKAERLRLGLGAGTLPTQVEIEEEAQNVEDLLLLEAEQKAEEEGGEPVRSSRAPRVAAAGRTPVPPMGGSGRMGPSSESSLGAGGRFGPGESSQSMGGRSFAPSRASGPRLPGVSSREPKYDPTYRARVAKAKSILCYYDPGSFHVSPIAYEQASPAPEEMWYAQVGLWVQEDVVKAIAELNKEAADQVRDADPCVEHVPVKRLVLMRVLGYERGDELGFLQFGAAGTAQIANELYGASLTGRQCNEQFDVVRFMVSVVIDQREVLQLIDRISRVNFYQCLSVSYEAVDREQETSEGYFYGTAPVVEATLGFEGYMSREVYGELMPAEVRRELGIDTD